ncbi:hypothetical protein [Dactylosporangium sp. CA-233914]|uniref:hypothetical protein n=1 Tax=Dactylosporangium sp. CA-233914 TaxID=3239934 RepID=UPI003D8EBF68
MKIHPLGWSLTGVALIAGFGVATGSGPADPPFAVDVARLAGCTGGQARLGERGVRETVTCTEDGFDVTAVTFDDNAQRDAWVEDLRVVVVTSGLAGFPDALVAGDRWAVRTGDADRADALVRVARGWRV